MSVVRRDQFALIDVSSGVAVAAPAKAIAQSRSPLEVTGARSGQAMMSEESVRLQSMMPSCDTVVGDRNPTVVKGDFNGCALCLWKEDRLQTYREIVTCR